MRFFPTLLSVLLALTTALPASAETGYFLDSDSLDLSRFPEPPQNGSARDRADMWKVINLQRTRNDELCKRAQIGAALDIDSIFGRPYGPLSPAQINQVRGIYDKVYSDTDLFVNQLKARFQRLRPYQVPQTQVKPCIWGHASASYPSGHASIARATSLVLARIFPKQAYWIKKRGTQAGWDRAIGGVHHPKDVQAGWMLGDLVYEALKHDPEFLAELAK